MTSHSFWKIWFYEFLSLKMGVFELFWNHLNQFYRKFERQKNPEIFQLCPWKLPQFQIIYLTKPYDTLHTCWNGFLAWGCPSSSPALLWACYTKKTFNFDTKEMIWHNLFTCFTPTFLSFSLTVPSLLMGMGSPIFWPTLAPDLRMSNSKMMMTFLPWMLLHWYLFTRMTQNSSRTLSATKLFNWVANMAQLLLYIPSEINNRYLSVEDPETFFKLSI